MHLDQNYPLKALNTFGMDVYARYFVEPGCRDEILTLMNYRHMVRLPVLFLGGGSNVLLVNDFGGLVVKISSKGIDYRETGTGEVLVTAQAGEIWDDFVGYCIGQGWAGLENLSLIPGTAGAAPIQNIGAYGVEAGELIERVSAVEIKTGREFILTRSECRFGYRDSIFKQELRDRAIVLDVTFRLAKFRHNNPSPDKYDGGHDCVADPGPSAVKLRVDYGDLKRELQAMGIADPSPANIRDAVVRIRSRKLPDPALLGNAGSFFRNPVISDGVYEALRKMYPAVPGYPAFSGSASHSGERTTESGKSAVSIAENSVSENESSDSGRNYKIPAAWLIEQCGWKGYRCGDAGVYPNQPLVLVNYGKASGREIVDLAHQISESVFTKFGIVLESEVNVIE